MSSNPLECIYMKVIHLQWHGPIELVDGFADRLREATQSGVYAFTGRHYAAPGVALLYIGKTTDSFYNRNWNELLNRDWLTRMSEHLGASFYYAPMEEHDWIAPVETALIGSHTPLYNSSQITSPSPLPEHLTIYNVGKLPPNMLPIVATDYPWGGKPDAFRVSS